MRHVVFLGEEARRAQHDDRKAMHLVKHAAKMLGRKLADAVDVARLQRRHLLVDPDGLVGAAFVHLANLLRDHERRRRGEDEAVDPGLGATASSRRLSVPWTFTATNVAARGGRCPACAVRRHGRWPRSPVAQRGAHDSPIDDRADDIGGRRRRGVEPDDAMAVAPQPRHERLAQPTRRSRHQDVHASPTSLIATRRRSARASTSNPAISSWNRRCQLIEP